MPILLRAVQEDKSIAQVLEEEITKSAKVKTIESLKINLRRFERFNSIYKEHILRTQEEIDNICEQLAQLGYFDVEDGNK